MGKEALSLDSIVSNKGTTDGAKPLLTPALTLDVLNHMTLLTLPPYSSELNPQESVWKEIKPEGFYNRVFETMDAVENQLVKVLRQFEQQAECLKKLTAWQWIRNALN